LWLSVTLLITIVIILISIFSIKSGYFDIFPYFHILPILLLAYLYPHYAVYFTIILGWIFLGLIYLYGPVDIRLYAASSTFFYIFVSIGVVISAFYGQLLQERKYRIFETNTIASRLLGYSKKEFMQMRLHDIDTHPEHLLTPEKIQRFQSRGHMLYETVQKKKDGTTVIVEISSRVTEYFGMSAVMSTVRDMSKRGNK
jgi:PAS domain S-box-containing protein